ncbi:MAG: HAD-IC family P-type ATPase [Prevotella sp.]|nr:HAD-IC family P-type ATPase [Prevotella sp.]
MISGEPAPVEKHDGDKVFAGTIVKEGTLRFRAEAVGEKTVLANIIRMVQQAQNSKAPVQRTVDRVALIFVPAVLCLSLLTFIVWFIVGGQPALPRAILSAVSVLVIACPCAMGLATPTALMVGIGKAAQHNILIKDATALEQIRRITALVIDKTGTLTEITDEQDAACKAQENTPSHIVAAPPCPPERAAASPTNEENQDQTNHNPQCSTFNVQRSTFNVQRESLKPHAAEAISMLHEAGVEVYMMSGDVEEHARYWAEQAGIRHYQSRVMPQDKEDLVRRLQTEGKVVAMAGDGINDTQALAAADVSIAMGQGTDIAMDVAQMTLMGSDLRRIPEAISLSRRTVNMIHQNLFWAFIYNIICIPLAAGVLRIFGIDFQITPMWASALMAFSSVSVVLNSLRLKLNN